MRAMMCFGAPSACASFTIHSEITAVMVSPTPGTRPIKASRPTVMPPGSTMAESIRLAIQSSRSIAARREKSSYALWLRELRVRPFGGVMSMVRVRAIGNK